METNITVVDSIMGSGKSSAMIQYMNEETDKKFIYITPYLDEVQRVKDECTCRLFKEPYRNSNTKMDNLLGLLEDGYNIATTHALFKNLDDRCMEYIRDNNYVLIMDEVIEVVEEVDIDKNDVDMLLDTRKIEINKDGQIMWIDKEYNGKFNEYKQALRNGDCYMYSNTIILWTFPIRILSLFKETYVLTHLFEGSMQCNYYKMNNIEYKYKSVKKVNDRYELCDFYIPKIGNELRDKVHVYEGRLNDIGYSKNKKTNPLSKSWYQKKGSTNERCRIVKNNIYNYFKNICKSKSNENMWTTFKDYKSKCKGNGYGKGFVPLNSRASNQWREKKYLAYGINRFMNPVFKNFFCDKGVDIDEDMYVLGEFIQWIWRSSIRDGEDIYIYIPSERMRNLLNKYFDLLS